MSLRPKVCLALAGAALVVTAGAWLLGQRIAAAPRLMVENTASGEVLLNQPVAPGARLTLSYLHSVSRTRVVGVFEVAEDGGLVVRETSFGTFGPGLPELRPGDRYEIKDGAIRQLGLDQRFPEMSVFVHPYTEHRLELGGRTLDLSARLPPGLGCGSRWSGVSRGGRDAEGAGVPALHPAIGELKRRGTRSVTAPRAAEPYPA